jgi:ABC-2 type transport system permease protein
MTGVGRLIRLILRRDRILLPLWAVILGVVPAGYAASFQGLFPTQPDLDAYARISAGNTGFVALYGPLRGQSLGELVAWRAGFLPVLIGLAALLTVVRHTRSDEEAGRSELIGAAAVGRRAQLAAALLVTGGASVLLGVITTAGLIGKGLPAGGSVALGAEFMLSGWLFAGVAAVTAQLASSARSARSIAVVVLGVSFVLRVAGDVSSIGDGRLSGLSWLSPTGLVQHLFPYGTNDWWPALPAVLFTLLTVVVGGWLMGRRDIGAGLFPARLGRPAAAPGLRSPLALAWRLHRGLLIGWTLGFAALGLIFGGVGASVVDLAQDSDFKDILGSIGGDNGLVNSYFAGTAGLIGLIASCYAVQAALRIHDEEQTGHAEVLLATAVSRYAWAGSHLLFSLLGPAVALAVEGLAAGLAYGGGDLGGIVAGTLIQLPAVWVLAAVTVLLLGLLPRYAMAAWAAPAICLLVLLVGETLHAGQWLLDVSPFTHIPHVPGGDVAATPLVALTVLALVVGFAGIGGLRRRDVPA